MKTNNTKGLVTVATSVVQNEDAHLARVTADVAVKNAASAVTRVVYVRNILARAISFVDLVHLHRARVKNAELAQSSIG